MGYANEPSINDVLNLLRRASKSLIEAQTARIAKLETALTLIAMFKPHAGEQTDFATAIAIAEEALKDGG